MLYLFIGIYCEDDAASCWMAEEIPERPFSRFFATSRNWAAVFLGVTIPKVAATSSALSSSNKGVVYDCYGFLCIYRTQVLQKLPACLDYPFGNIVFLQLIVHR
jgi:hypothetical protein